MDWEQYLDKQKGGSKEEPQEKESYQDSEAKLDESEISKVKTAISSLQPLAEKEGCSVGELVEKYNGEEDDEEEAEGMDDAEPKDEGGKVALIVSRMKSKEV